MQRDRAGNLVHIGALWVQPPEHQHIVVKHPPPLFLDFLIHVRKVKVKCKRLFSFRKLLRGNEYVVCKL